MTLSRSRLIPLISVPIFAFIAYFAIAQFVGGTGDQSYAYFDKLAYSFLRGELFITSSVKDDLTFYDGRWYVPFPPLTAILMIPWLWFQQIPPIDAILFSIGIGSINVWLTYLILAAASERGLTELEPSDNLWLTLFFGFGTVHLMMTLQGTVWFLAQITAYTFVALSIWVALKKGHPLWVGLALGIAMFSRPHVAITGLLALAIVRAVRSPEKPFWATSAEWRSTIVQGLWILISLLVAVVGLLSYNQLRFDDWRDFGYLSQSVADELEDDLDTYGQFNLYFVPRNVRAMVWAPPTLGDNGWPVPDRWGMSIFLASPLFLLLFRRLPAPSRTTTNRLIIGAAWLSAGLILIPLLTYYNTGWWQFGYRFLLDLMIPLLLILAMTIRNQRPWGIRGLILLSIGINLWGTAWFAVITFRI